MAGDSSAGGYDLDRSSRPSAMKRLLLVPLFGLTVAFGQDPYLIAEKLGRGHVVLFADDPNFRLLWPRLTRLFANAVFLAPSIP
jgi:hypothetical protein